MGTRPLLNKTVSLQGRHYSDFGAQMEAKSIKKRFKNLPKNQPDLECTSRVILVNFGGQNEMKFREKALRKETRRRKGQKRVFIAICNGFA